MSLSWQERSAFSPASSSGSCWSCAPVLRPVLRHVRTVETAAQMAPRLPGRYIESVQSKAVQSAADDVDYVPYTAMEYTPAVNEEYWEQRPVAVLRRAAQVGQAFSMWFVSSKLFGEGGLWHIDGRQAEKLRKILTELGPAFVKIGQAFSSRPDVVSPKLLRELEKLQDKIPPFSDAEAMAIIHEDLGQPAGQLFSEISEQSVAAASLGQVYKARIRSTGQLVAVKVQRPHVRERIALDVYIMRYFAGRLGALRKLNSDLPSLLDEWATSLFRELDYRQEAQNGTLFRDLYSHLEAVYVPEMIHELTSGRVLVMEWLDGVRLRSAGQSPSEGQILQPEDMKLIEFGVQCSLEQMLEEGFYHADPHPGNLLRLRNGKLGYLDFGMMASIGPTIRRSLITATLHMVNREFESLADDFEALGLLPAGSEKEKVVPALAGVFEKALAGGVSNLSFGNLSSDLGRTMYEFNFRIPAYYTLLVRSLSVLEGIALSSDPNYKVLGAAYPWIARRLLSDPSPELQDTLRALLYKNGKFQFSRLESLLRQALRSPARPGRGPIVQDRASSLADKPLELLLGKDGAFVRGIVLDELAKGIDAALRLSTDGAVGRARSRLASIFRDTVSARQGPSTAPPQRSSNDLLATLRRLPKLADKSDKEQVDGITGLLRVLQQVRAGQNPTTASASTARPAELNEAVLMLQWILQELGNLSPEARIEALRLPLSLGAKLSSRLFARAIKAFVGRDSNNGKAQPSNTRARTAVRTAPPSQVVQPSMRTVSPTSASLKASQADVAVSSSSETRASSASLQTRNTAIRPDKMPADVSKIQTRVTADVKLPVARESASVQVLSTPTTTVRAPLVPTSSPEHKRSSSEEFSKATELKPSNISNQSVSQAETRSWQPQKSETSSSKPVPVAEVRRKKERPPPNFPRRNV